METISISVKLTKPPKSFSDFCETSFGTPTKFEVVLPVHYPGINENQKKPLHFTGFWSSYLPIKHAIKPRTKYNTEILN